MGTFAQVYFRKLSPFVCSTWRGPRLSPGPPAVCTRESGPGLALSPADALLPWHHPGPPHRPGEARGPARPGCPPGKAEPWPPLCSPCGQGGEPLVPARCPGLNGGAVPSQQLRAWRLPSPRAALGLGQVSRQPRGLGVARESSWRRSVVPPCLALALAQDPGSRPWLQEAPSGEGCVVDTDLNSASGAEWEGALGAGRAVLRRWWPWALRGGLRVGAGLQALSASAPSLRGHG